MAVFGLPGGAEWAVIALVLGWLFAGEELNARILIASAVTVVAVALIVGGKFGARAKRTVTTPEPEK